MRTFNKKKLALALGAALGLAGSASLQAAPMALAQDGLGDAGIVSFETSKGDWQTLYRIYNSSDRTVLVKVRFRESANSREKLDFLVWLSPYDTWNFWTDDDAGGTAAVGPGIRTRDTSCTTPNPTTGPSPQTFGWVNGNSNSGTRYALFKDLAFTGDYDDGTELAAAERLKEGYFEVIGVASWPRTSLVSVAASHSTDVLDNEDDRPLGCSQLASNFGFGKLNPSEGADDVGNVLAMNAYLLRTNTGQGTGIPVDVIANFSDPDYIPGTTPDIPGTPPDSPAYQRLLWEVGADAQKPDMDSANQESVVQLVQAYQDEAFFGEFADADGTAFPYRRNLSRNLILQQRFDPSPEVATWEPGDFQIGYVRGGVDAVAWMLQREGVVNEWMRRVLQDSSTPSAIPNTFSQWVITQPLKHYYVDSFADPIATNSINNLDNIYPTLAPEGAPIRCYLDGALTTTMVGSGAVFGPYSETYGGEYTIDGSYIPTPERPYPNCKTVKQPGESCDTFGLYMVNTEEGFVDFTSPVPTELRDGICSEVAVLQFGSPLDPVSGANLGLEPLYPIDVPESMFPRSPYANVKSQNADLGWAEMYWDSGTLADGTEGPSGGDYLYGKPTTGFLFATYQTTPGNVGGNSSMAQPHKYVRGACVDDGPVGCYRDDQGAIRE